MNISSLSDWLVKIKSLHVAEMDLSLERVMEVASRLNLLKPSCLVVTIAGTNGKGSTVAGLEAIYKAQGYRVGAFTTPFLFRHQEQIRVLGNEASNSDFCEAYEEIEKARGFITLTPFEFNALAAFYIFRKAKLDIWLLEVGLGGRWDAVNVIDTDLAVVTSIGIDHTEWLGDTREKIAREKAGIFRLGKPVVCGDFDPPYSLIEAANHLNAPFYCQEKEFGFKEEGSSWKWWSHKSEIDHLPKSQLALQNMATVLQVVELLQDRLPVSIDSIRQALSVVNLPGRIQVIAGDVTQVLDVSHNPAAAEWLAKWARENPVSGKTRSVFSMLADKDIVSTLEVIKECVDDWYIGSIKEARGASLDLLQTCFQKAGISKVTSYGGVKEAYQAAMNQSKLGDRVLIFGSFRTVADIHNLI